MANRSVSVDDALGAPFSKKLSVYAKLSGPGWLQAAVTLGGGSLASSLYLGVIGGYEFLWLQPLAMLCGIVMLGTISWVTLSIEERPFRAIQKHVSPTLAWGWLIATVVADTVFCIAQFAVGSGAVTGNLGLSLGSPFVVTGLLFLVSFGITWLYIGETKSAKLFDKLLKVLVALVVISFFATTITLLFSGRVDIVALLSGLIPDFGSLFRPVEALQPAIAATGEAAPFWEELITGSQRNRIIAAFGSAVGINMTFLLPYTLAKRGWTKKHRELSFFDLGLGLFIPFIIATGCLIIVSGAIFHSNSSDVFGDIESGDKAAISAYEATMKKRLAWGAESSEGDVSAAINLLPRADQELGAMIANRNAVQLARGLAPLMGDTAAQWVFGLGVLAMAVSTMIIHQIMNGFAISEAFNKPGEKKLFVIGALMPATAGLFAPILWTGDAKIALVVPAAVIATTLLPLAYLAFILLFNSKEALGKESLSGRPRIIGNTLMGIAAGIATFGSVWGLWGRGDDAGRYGIVALAALMAVSVVGFFRRRA